MTIRFDWGPHALDRCESTVVVVDVLCFTTCVSIAASRGVTIIPHRWREPVNATDAIVAKKRGEPGFTLSPATFLDAPRGLRVVLPSPNGSTIARIAADRGLTVIAGSLRNAAAVARAIASTPATIIASGEKRSDGTIRFALEDLLGAGAIIDAASAPRTYEAEAAAAAFRELRLDLREALSECESGIELLERGYPQDIALAADIDADDVVPHLTRSLG